MTKVVTEYTAKIKSNLPRHLDKTAVAAKRATKELDRTQKTAARLGATRVSSHGGIAEMGEQAEKASGRFSKFTIALVAMYASYRAFLHFAARSDEWTNISNKLRFVTANSLDLESVQKRLVDLAVDTRSNLDAVATTYQRVGRAIERTGASADDTYNVVKALALGIKTTGIASDEARQALRQITQAFNKGKLDGDEFRSVAENMPVVLDAISRKAGISRGELMKWARQGKITSELMKEGLLEALPQLEADFKKVRPTVSDTTESLSAAWTEMIGTLANSTNALSPVISTLNALTESVRWVTSALEDWEARETSLDDAVTQGGSALARRERISRKYLEVIDRLGGDKTSKQYQYHQRSIEILDLARKSPTAGGGRVGDYAEPSNPAIKFLQELRIDRRILQERRQQKVLTPELFQSQIRGLSGRAQRGALDNQVANQLAGNPELLRQYRLELDIIKSLIRVKKSSIKQMTDEQKETQAASKAIADLGDRYNFYNKQLKYKVITEDEHAEKIAGLDKETKNLLAKYDDQIDGNNKLEKAFEGLQVGTHKAIKQAQDYIKTKEELFELDKAIAEFDKEELRLEEERKEKLRAAIARLAGDLVTSFSGLAKTASGQETSASRIGAQIGQGIASGDPLGAALRGGSQFLIEAGRAIIKVAEGHFDEGASRSIETPFEKRFTSLIVNKFRDIDELEKGGVYTKDRAQAERRELRGEARELVASDPRQVLRWLQDPTFFSHKIDHLKKIGIETPEDLRDLIEKMASGETVADKLTEANDLLRDQLNELRRQSQLEKEALRMQIEAQRQELNLRAAEARDAVSRQVVEAYRTPGVSAPQSLSPQPLDVHVQIVDDPQRIDQRIQSPEGSASVTQVAHMNADEYGEVTS